MPVNKEKESVEARLRIVLKSLRKLPKTPQQKPAKKRILPKTPPQKIIEELKEIITDENTFLAYSHDYQNSRSDLKYTNDLIQIILTDINNTYVHSQLKPRLDRIEQIVILLKKQGIDLINKVSEDIEKSLSQGHQYESLEYFLTHWKFSDRNSHRSLRKNPEKLVTDFRVYIKYIMNDKDNDKALENIDFFTSCLENITSDFTEVEKPDLLLQEIFLIFKYVKDPMQDKATKTKDIFRKAANELLKDDKDLSKTFLGKIANEDFASTELQFELFKIATQASSLDKEDISQIFNIYYGRSYGRGTSKVTIKALAGLEGLKENDLKITSEAILCNILQGDAKNIENIDLILTEITEEEKQSIFQYVPYEKNQHTTLHIAAMRSNKEVLEVLLKHEPSKESLEKIDHEENTIFHHLSSRPRQFPNEDPSSIIETVIDLSKNTTEKENPISLANKHGENPLHTLI